MTGEEEKEVQEVIENVQLADEDMDEITECIEQYRNGSKILLANGAEKLVTLLKKYKLPENARICSINGYQLERQKHRDVFLLIMLVRALKTGKSINYSYKVESQTMFRLISSEIAGKLYTFVLNPLKYQDLLKIYKAQNYKNLQNQVYAMMKIDTTKSSERIRLIDSFDVLRANLPDEEVMRVLVERIMADEMYTGVTVHVRDTNRFKIIEGKTDDSGKIYTVSTQSIWGVKDVKEEIKQMAKNSNYAMIVREMYRKSEVQQGFKCLFKEINEEQVNGMTEKLLEDKLVEALKKFDTLTIKIHASTIYQKLNDNWTMYAILPNQEIIRKVQKSFTDLKDHRIEFKAHATGINGLLGMNQDTRIMGINSVWVVDLNQTEIYKLLLLELERMADRAGMRVHIVCQLTGLAQTIPDKSCFISQKARHDTFNWSTGGVTFSYSNNAEISRFVVSKMNPGCALEGQLYAGDEIHQIDGQNESDLRNPKDKCAVVEFIFDRFLKNKDNEVNFKILRTGAIIRKYVAPAKLVFNEGAYEEFKIPVANSGKQFGSELTGILVQHNKEKHFVVRKVLAKDSLFEIGDILVKKLFWSESENKMKRTLLQCANENNTAANQIFCMLCDQKVSVLVYRLKSIAILKKCQQIFVTLHDKSQLHKSLKVISTPELLMMVENWPGTSHIQKGDYIAEFNGFNATNFEADYFLDDLKFAFDNNNSELKLKIYRPSS